MFYYFPLIATATWGFDKILLPQKVSCTCMQGFMVKYNLSVNRGGDFSDEPQGADLARQKT